MLWIPACDSSGPAFRMLHSAEQFNQQGDTVQPSHTSFPILEQFVAPSPVLTIASCPACRFLRRQVRQSGIPTWDRKTLQSCLNTHSLRGRGQVTAAQETELGTRQEPRTQPCHRERSAAWRGPGAHSPDGLSSCS